MTKKTIAIIMACVIVIGTGIGLFFAFRPNRDDELRIHNWDYFLCDNLLAEFQTYWRTQTGNSSFRVRQTNFASNEQLRSRLNRGYSFDLAVPSDYMVERFIAEGRIRQLDLGRLHALSVAAEATPFVHNVETREGYPANWQFDSSVIDPRITGAIPTGAQGQHFAVPYLYGTMGIMFDNRIEGLREAIEYYGWASLWAYNRGLDLTPTWETFHPNYPTEQLSRTHRPSIKDIGRENYTVGRLAMNRTQLLELSGQDAAGATIADADFTSQAYQDLLNKLFGPEGLNGRDFAQEIAAVAQFYRNNMHPNRIIERPDQSIEEFLAWENLHDMGIEWSVSAMFTILLHDTPQYIGYVIPREGTNLWVNNFVIPNTANRGSIDAAYGFIEWINRPENAVRNIWETGSSTPIIAASDEAYNDITDPESDFFDGKSPEWQAMFMDAFFPMRNPNVLARAATMRYFGQGRDSELNEMMRQIRLIQ